MRAIILGLLALTTLALGACVTTADQPAVDRVRQVRLGYEVVRATALAYAGLPDCDQPGVKAPCSRAAVVAEITKADAAVAAAFDAATAIAARADATPDEVSIAIEALLQAVIVLQRVVTTYGIG